MFELVGSMNLVVFILINKNYFEKKNNVLIAV